MVRGLFIQALTALLAQEEIELKGTIKRHFDVSHLCLKPDPGPRDKMIQEMRSTIPPVSFPVNMQSDFSTDKCSSCFHSNVYGSGPL